MYSAHFVPVQDASAKILEKQVFFVLKGLFIVRRRLFTDSWLSVNNCRLFTDSELDRLGAGLALHVATPVELALATLFHSEGKYNREDKTMKSMRGHG